MKTKTDQFMQSGLAQPSTSFTRWSSIWPPISAHAWSNELPNAHKIQEFATFLHGGRACENLSCSNKSLSCEPHHTSWRILWQTAALSSFIYVSRFTCQKLRRPVGILMHCLWLLVIIQVCYTPQATVVSVMYSPRACWLGRINHWGI